jgi:hypothetical protein
MYTIPDQLTATYPYQAMPDPGDFQTLALGTAGSGVISGCAVTQRAAGANMSVDVAVGVVSSLGKRLAVTATNLAIGSNATGNPRIDMIVVSSAGTPTVRAGTAATTPLYAAMTTGDVFLAAVSVPNSAASILNANIIAKDIPIKTPRQLSVKDFGAKGDCRKLTDGAITAATATFTSASAGFTAADVSKRIFIQGAGAAAIAGNGGVLGPLGQVDTTITGFTNATTVTIGVNATTTVSGATWYYGTDDTAAFNAAITAAAAVPGGMGVWVDSGTYTVNNVNAQANVDILSDAATLVHMGGGASTHAINAVGTTGTSTLLTANVAINASTVVVTSATGFAVGDFCLLRDNTYKIPAVSAGRNQEIVRIASISGTTFTLISLTIGAYTTAQSATLLKLLPINNVLIQGLTLENPVGQDVGGNIILTYCYNVTLNNLTCLRPNDDAGIYIIQSAVCFVSNCYVRDGQDRYHTNGGYGYGIVLEESNHGIVVSNCNTEAVRENELVYNCRYCIINGLTDIGAVDSSFNGHGTGNEGCGIVNSISIGSGQAGTNGAGYGFYFGGGRADSFDNDCFISNCLVVGNKGHGILIQGGAATVRSVRCSVTNNTIMGNGVSVAGSAGILINNTDSTLVSGNSVTGPSTSIDSGIYLINATNTHVIGNQITAINNGYGIKFQNGSTNCVIEANHMQGNTQSIIDVAPANTGTVVRNNVCNGGSIVTLAGTFRGGNILAGVMEPPFDDVDHRLWFTPGLHAANITTVTAITTGLCYAQWLGCAMSTVTTIDVELQVTALVATITWAEVAIFTGNPVANAGTNLTRVGFTNVAATYNTTGRKKTTVALTGVAPGDNLWVVYGSSATTPFQIRGMLADDNQSGVFLTATTRPSTAAAATAFALGGAAVVPGWIVAVT